MVERRQIVAMARRSAGEAGVLVTLVRAEGSSYRRPGARLLTFARLGVRGYDQRGLPRDRGGQEGDLEGAQRRGDGALLDAIR